MRGGTVNGQTAVLKQEAAEIPPVDTCLPCDMAKSVTAPHLDTVSCGNGEISTMAIDYKTRTELEAAVFRRLVQHLRARTDVQNIDLMNLAGFCRNCLSNWLKEETDARGAAISKDESREAVYGMPYET